MYWDAFHWIIHITKCKLSPFAAHINFLKALMNDIRSQFPNAIIVSCFFHFKQALFRWLKKSSIHLEQVQMSMEPNCIDLLTIIPKKKIIKLSIPYLKIVIKSMPDFSKSNTKKWDEFWAYFKRFWYSNEKFIATWNIHNEKTDGYPDIHNCTSNGLER